MNRALLVFTLSLAAGRLPAQETGSIGGVVTDPTGAVLPDTSVSLENEAGILSRTRLTGARGGYGFSGLPVGRYRVSFEKSGFRPAVGRQVAVMAGASIELDVTLEIESLADEVVEVSAARSIERKAAHPSDVLDRSYLEGVPSGRSIWSVLELTGSLVSDRIDVGGSESGQQSRIAAAGTTYAQNQYFLNGVNLTDSAALGASATYYSFDSFEELSASVRSHPAEVQSPGVHFNVVVKSGTSKIHGGAAAYFENDSLQSDNLDDFLRAQGVSQSGKLGSYFDGTLELSGPAGGRALWYASFSRQEIDPYVIGFFLPDGEPGSDPTTLTTYLARGTIRIGAEENVNLFFFRNDKLRESRDASRFRPTPESALYQDSTTSVLQGAYSRVFRASALFDARVALVNLHFPLGERPDLPADSFSRIELANGIRSGGPGTNEIYERDRVQADATVSFFQDDWLSGSHDWKMGFQLNVSPTSTTYDLNGAVLYRDLFGSPLQVEIYSDPMTREERTSNASFFAQDTYGRERVVLNLGVRLDYWSAGYPDQGREPGPWEEFFRARGLPESVSGDSSAASFTSIAPRLGVTYSLTEDGKTLLRGGYGRYYHQIGSSLGAFVNPNGRASALFPFADSDFDRVVDPGEIDFEGPIAVNLPATNEVNPDLAQPRSDEATVGIEHELSPGLTLSGTAMYRRDRLLIDDVNVGVRFSDYREALARDPGRDLVPGTEDDALLPVFNQSRLSLGQDRFLLTNPEGLESSYRGIELVARRRFEGGWQLLASLALGESSGFLPGPGLESTEGASFATPLYDNPNTLVNANGRTFWDRPRIFRISGSYDWRFGVRFAGAYRYQIGQPLYRSIQVRQTAEGVPLNQGPIEMLAEPSGAALQPDLHVLDLRAEKGLELDRYGRLDLVLDLFNAFNANTATDMSSRMGSFGAILRILPPRVARIGVRYRF